MSQLFIVSGPSGAGKTSLLKQAIREHPTLGASISHTTRPSRPGEVSGKDYYFVSEQEFESMRKQGLFLESAEIFGYRYGTSREPLALRLAEGKDVVLEIDWQGARQIKASPMRPPNRSLFILPPSKTALRTRLEDRGQDSAEVIGQRMEKALDEMRHYRDFDEVLVNDDFASAAAQLQRFFAGGAFDLAHRERVEQTCRALGL